MISATIILVACALHVALAAEWTYGDGPLGPSHWGTHGYPDCAEQNQSPINIFEGDVSKDNSLTAFSFKNYDVVLGIDMEMTNNGHTAVVNLGGTTKAEVSGGGLTGTFIVKQFHFHWGVDSSLGSEHLISTGAYPMELHIVHYNSKYPDIGTAVNQPDGLAVLGFMFTISPTDNPNYAEIVTNLFSIRMAETKIALTPFMLSKLLPPALNQYYRYGGSLTTPPCSESVTWTVFKDPISISEKQMEAFRAMFAGQAEVVPLVNNFRPVQALNARSVVASYEPDVHWSFDHGLVDTAHWKDYYSSCGASNQSPINIPSVQAELDNSLNNFVFTNYDNVANITMEMHNNGHVAQVNLGGSPIKVSGGGLDSTYVAAQFHFHWGSINVMGSEHTVDGTSYPMELHIVHYKESLGSLGASVKAPQGLAVLGFFFEISPTDNVNLKPIIDTLAKVKAPKTHTAMSAVTLDSMLPDTLTDFYRYSGSLTTPGCFESVTWTVFDAKIPISEAQLQAFRGIQSSDKMSNGNYYNLVNNFRPVQNLNTRTVKRSFIPVQKPKIHWAYEGSHGPSHWQQYFPACTNTFMSRQSPIDFVPRTITYDQTLPSFTFSNYNTTTGVNMTIKNNGHTVEAGYESGDLFITNGGLPGTFKVAQFHFHWGSDNSQGSEHVVNGFAYPNELHIVHYNTIYSSVGVAASQPNGLAVLGFFIQVSVEPNPAFDILLNSFSSVQQPDTKNNLDSFPLMDLLPKNKAHYYRYDGSLTTPGCYQSVTWTVFRESIFISQQQLAMFRKLKSSEKGANNQYLDLFNNYRPPQPINGRTIRANFQISPDSARSLTASLLLTLMSLFSFVGIRVIM